MLIDHIGLSVSDYERSKAFYSKVLAPLDVTLIMEVKGFAGFGKRGKPEFWIGESPNTQVPMHIAFVAENREAVRQFYDTAIQAGAKDNGAPGIREIYHPNYYGAFVLDPDGHNIEAVCHEPE